MKKIKLVPLAFLLIHKLFCLAQSEPRLDTLSAYEFDRYHLNNCCENKKEFCKLTDEFIRRIRKQEPVSVEMATRLLEHRYRITEFFSEDETNAFVKKILDADISYDNQLRLEIYYQILKYYRLNLSEEEKDSLLVNAFKIREQFYLELIKFQEFNRNLANTMRGTGDTILFQRFNGDVIDDVEFSNLNIGDKPINVLDRRMSEKLFEVQIAAFWDRVDFYKWTKNKKALEDIRGSKSYLFQVFRGQPYFIPQFNLILKGAQLDTIPMITNSRVRD